MYDLEAGAETELEADPEGGSAGGPPTLPMDGARGPLIPPSLNGGRVAFATYQFVNRVYEDSDIVLSFRGAPPATPASSLLLLLAFAVVALLGCSEPGQAERVRDQTSAWIELPAAPGGPEPIDRTPSSELLTAAGDD